MARHNDTSVQRYGEAVDGRACVRDALPALGEPLFFSADAERTLWQAEVGARTVLVFGRESTGLPAEVRARWRARLVGFPMADPELRSLNLASTVTAALYEVLRRRAGS